MWNFVEASGARCVSRLQLSRDSHAHFRVDRTLRPRRGRGNRRRRERDVHLGRSRPGAKRQRPVPDPPSRKHRRRGPRLHRAQTMGARTQQALLHRSAVSAGASAERALSPVLSDRGGSHRAGKRGQRVAGARCRSAGAAGDFARPAGHQGLDLRTEFSRLRQRPRSLQRSSAQGARAGGLEMCEDCQRRAVTNPLRVFDCKVPEDQPIIEKLPRISQFLDEALPQTFRAGAGDPDGGRRSLYPE